MKKLTFGLLVVMLATGPALAFPAWRYETPMSWEPVDILGAGVEPHRCVGVPQIPGFNEITGNLSLTFGPLVYNSLRHVTFMDEEDGWTEHEQKLWRFWDGQHFGQHFNLSMFNRVLILDRERTDDPERSAILMFLEDRSRVVYKEASPGVWRSTFFTGTRLESGNFPEDPSTLYTPDGTTWIFKWCDNDPMRRFQFVDQVIDRYGNEVRVVRHTDHCLPEHIVETTVDGSESHDTYIAFDTDPEDPADLGTLEQVVFHNGTPDAEYYFFEYERETSFLGQLTSPPRLVSIRSGDPSQPENQEMMCLYYEPLAYWGETFGYVLHYVQGPFRAGTRTECELRTVGQIGPITEYVFDRNGRLREIEYPSRMGYSIHYQEGRVDIAQAWHYKPDLQQDCCAGQLRDDGAGGTMCDTSMPIAANFNFCPLHELTLLSIFIEGTAGEAQVVRTEDNYGRWETFERDFRGQVVRRSTFDGLVYDYVYDNTLAGRDLPVVTVDPLGRRVRAAYDEWGNVTMRESGDGTHITMGYHDAGDPGWAFGTPKWVRREGWSGWLGSAGGAAPVEETTFVAGTDSGNLVIEEHLVGSSVPTQTLKMSQSGRVIERTNNSTGMTNVIEWSGSQSTLKWRSASDGQTGQMGTVQLSSAGQHIDGWTDMFNNNGSVVRDSVNRIVSVNQDESVKNLDFDDQGRVINSTEGLRCTASGCPAGDTLSQDVTTRVQYDPCSGVISSHLSSRAGNPVDSGYTYLDNKECRVQEDVEGGDQCDTTPEEAQCSMENDPWAKYGFCNRLKNPTGSICGCALRCECTWTCCNFMDPNTCGYANCSPAGFTECMEWASSLNCSAYDQVDCK